jgi:hypothetical protein
MFRSAAAVTVCTLALVGLNAWPATADPPTVRELEIVGPAPMISAACGFPVTRHIFVTIRTYPAPENATPFASHAVIHTTGTFSGPTGRGFSATTNDNVMVRELADGTLVEIDTGHTLSFTGRVYDFGGDSATVSGQTIPASSYCDALAP